MTKAQVRLPTAATPPTFQVRSPATGDILSRYPEHDAAHVAATVTAARTAAPAWAALSFAERGRMLDRWRGEIARGADSLAQVMNAEVGKPVSDARLEIVMALQHLAWAAKNAGNVLGRRRMPSDLMTLNQAATLEYTPLGVVGVIGPWNYPVFTPLGSLSFALAAGNAVVFKPSEFSPGVGEWLVRAFERAVPEHPVLHLVTGSGTTGAALCESGVDKIGFTGSTATGKAVLAACARSLTPVLMECGGKDALVVDADADLDAAADAAVWGALSNAGQTCLGVERVYVHESVYDQFLERVLTKAKDVRAGAGGGAKIGPITMPSQVAVIRAHIEDAFNRGGRAVLGGLDTIDGQFVQPTILVDVPEDALAVTEETFGPTMTIAKVDDMDQAVELVNASRYHLGVTIFARGHGGEIARRIRAGGVAVNAFVAYATIPTLPLGGVGESGFGRVHGPDGLREFTYPKAVTRQRFPAPLALTTFARTEFTDRVVRVLTALLHGRNR